MAAEIRSKAERRERRRAAMAPGVNASPGGGVEKGAGAGLRNAERRNYGERWGEERANEWMLNSLHPT